MVIERFRSGDADAVGQRLAARGRMLPEGVVYHVSWIDPAGMRCFQLLEARRSGLITKWVESWSDLVQFEIVPVVSSADFWAIHGRSTAAAGYG